MAFMLSLFRDIKAMQDLRFSNKNRIAATMIAVMVIVFMLFSALFIAVETAHHCDGEDCPICSSIQQCENIFHHVGGGLTILISALLPIIFAVTATAVSTFFLQGTPVSNKVRLNN